MNTFAQRLAIGTAQFGLDYGVTNQSGRVEETEARTILQLARERGISTLDTAAAYGDAEAVLGRLEAKKLGFRIITKTEPIPNAPIDAAAISAIERGLERSRRRLGTEKLDAVLLHHGRNLLQPGGTYLLDLLARIRARSQIDRVGVSVYDPQELAGILELFTPDIVQLPFNILDQRFRASGMLQRLHGLRIEVHARSLFLQGTLIAREGGIPGRLAYLAPLVAQFSEACRSHNETRLSACLGHGLAQEEIACLVVGVTRRSELAAIIDAAAIGACAPRDWRGFANSDLSVVDPSRWPNA